MNTKPARSASRLSQVLLGAAVLALGLNPASALACAACYGQSDSPLAAGMNYGILSLLGIVGVVLAGIATCFYRMARYQAASSRLQNQTPETALEPGLSTPVPAREA